MACVYENMDHCCNEGFIVERASCLLAQAINNYDALKEKIERRSRKKNEYPRDK